MPTYKVPIERVDKVVYRGVLKIEAASAEEALKKANQLILDHEDDVHNFLYESDTTYGEVEPGTPIKIK